MITALLISLIYMILVTEIGSALTYSIPIWHSNEGEEWLNNNSNLHKLVCIWTNKSTRGYISTGILNFSAKYHIKLDNGKYISIMRFSPLHRRISKIVKNAPEYQF